MRLVFAGTPATAEPSLRRLLDSPEHEVIAVVTRPDAEAGRGRGVRRSPVGRLADEAGVRVLMPRNPGDEDFLAELSELRPDCCPVVAYGALLPQRALDIPVHGWVNLHFSLLPAWRGAAPVQAAIRAGDDITGATTFQIVKELDSGPVFGVVTERIRPVDTSGDLLGRLADSGATLLESTMDGIAAGALVAQPQPSEGASYASKITVESARVDWSAPAAAVDRQIRSVTPDPGAWTVIGETRVKLGPVTVAQPGEGDDLAPGRVQVTKRALYIGTATGSVRLGTVQAQGKKAMQAADWARGARLDPEVHAQ